MNIALIVPGGVDRSGTHRVIPALLALITRLAREHSVRVFALRQEMQAAQWPLAGATVFNLGGRWPALRLLPALRREHARAPFDVIHSIWGGAGAFAAVVAGRLFDVPALVHLAGGELAALPQIAYGGRLRPARRVVDGWTLRHAAAVTAASRPLIELAATLGIAARRVPLGVDLDTWPVRAPRARTPGAPARLLHVAA